MTRRQEERERWLGLLKKVSKDPYGREFIFELLALLRYANSIDPHDAETCALQNLARRLMSDLAEANVDAAKELHAQASGWGK